jgi:hypothetical protein
MGAHDNSDDAVASIEAAYQSRWRAWISDTGRWWAARTDPLTAAELGVGCLPFLGADNPDELSRLINAQEELRASAAPRPSARPRRATDARCPGTNGPS